MFIEERKIKIIENFIMIIIFFLVSRNVYFFIFCVGIYKNFIGINIIYLYLIKLFIGIWMKIIRILLFLSEFFNIKLF